MSDCEQFERLISDRLDSELSSEQKGVLNDHLAICHSCSEFLANATRQREFLRALPEITVSIQDAAAPLRWWQRRLTIPIPIAAALALITISGWLMVLGSQDAEVDAIKSGAPVIRSVEIIRVDAAQAVQISDGKANGKKDEVL